MFRRDIPFDKDSFLEVASRITASGEQLMLSLRGLKNDREATIASAVLTQEDAKQLISHLDAWLKSKPKTLKEIEKDHCAG